MFSEAKEKLNNQAKDANSEKKDVSLQPKERKYDKDDIERVFAGNDAVARTFEEAGNSGVRDSSTKEVGRSSGSKESVLGDVVRRAKGNNVWFESIKRDLADDYIGSGQEKMENTVMGLDSIR